MDTVEGVKAKEEPCILTLLLITTNLQLYFKLERKTAEEVNKVFSYIKKSQQLGEEARHFSDREESPFYDKYSVNLIR